MIDSLDKLHQEVRDSFFPIEFWSPKTAVNTLSSKFETRKLGALRITEGTASSALPFKAQLPRRRIARDFPDDFVLLISQEGRVQHMQFGRTGVTHPGRMMLIHSRAPYQLQSESEITSLLVSIPGGLLRSAVGTPEDYCLVPMDAGSGFNALFREFMHSIWHRLDELNDDQQAFLVKELLSLLVAALQSVDVRGPHASALSREDQHFEQALHFIEANLADFSLDVDAIAHALRLSHSRLHAIARNKGTSIGQTILNRRLEHCARALADPRCRNRGIAQIAFTWGFINGAHFSDAFKSKYGITPRDFRKRHLQSH